VISDLERELNETREIVAKLNAEIGEYRAEAQSRTLETDVRPKNFYEPKSVDVTQETVSQVEEPTDFAVELSKKQREKAIKSLKQGKMFGGRNIGRFFQWPTEQDLQAMPLDQPISISSIDLTA
jgi:hypothetical protein